METGLQSQKGTRQKSSGQGGSPSYGFQQEARTLVWRHMGRKPLSEGYPLEWLLESPRPNWIWVSREGSRVPGQCFIVLITARYTQAKALDLLRDWSSSLSEQLTAAGIHHRVALPELSERNHIQQRPAGQIACHVFLASVRIVLQ